MGVEEARTHRWIPQKEEAEVAVEAPRPVQLGCRHIASSYMMRCFEATELRPRTESVSC